jgi:WXG100 family type VII secretion target
MSDDILYDPATMTTLYDDLNSAGSTLHTEAENLKGYANQFQNAIQGSSANENFNAVFSKWGNDYEDSLTNLQALQKSVDDAMNRALQADQAVGQGFNVF